LYETFNETDKGSATASRQHPNTISSVWTLVVPSGCTSPTLVRTPYGTAKTSTCLPLTATAAALKDRTSNVGAAGALFRDDASALEASLLGVEPSIDLSGSDRISDDLAPLGKPERA
jgi:hypothetical protein